MNVSASRDRLVVYTVLMGQGAELNPVPRSSNVDYVCLTDQEIDQPQGWSVRMVEPVLPGDIPRSSRHPKVNPHCYFSDYSRSIYVDTSVRLLKDPELLWDRLVPQSEVVFGAIFHSFRFRMMDVFTTVSALRFDDNSRLLQQLEASLKEFPGYLNVRPVWGAILARRHNDPDVKFAMEHWYSHIERYSRRDQTSLPLAIRTLRGNKVSLAHLDNHESDYYVWPFGGYQKRESYLSTDETNVDWSLYETGERDILLAERDAVVAERDALLSSKSWKITQPLRDLRRAFTGNHDNP